MFFITVALISSFGDKLAYLDPGSGSFLIQLLLATILGAGIALRASWSKVKRLFGIKSDDVDKDADDDEEGD